MNNQSLYCSFHLDMDAIIDQINRSGAATVGLQFPEGLKRSAHFIAQELKKRTTADMIVSGNPCFGACDIDMDLSDMVDILFHFGHSKLVDCPDNVIFIETPARANIDSVLEKAAVKLGTGTVGLVTTVQHVHQLERTLSFLRSKGISCVIGTGDSRIKYPGQVLGCNFSAADVACDQFLYIGSGKFHPLGVAIATRRSVLAADPVMHTVERVDYERILRIRHGIITSCLRADTFGIIVSTKIGQKRIELARRMAKLANKHGKSAIIISMDNITPDTLIQFKMNAFINTACPRIAIDDTGIFNAPMLNPVEFEILLGERDWNEFVFDEITE